MNKSTENIVLIDNAEQLARFAKALGHPTRIAILQHLEKQTCCFTGDLVDIFPLAQSTISQHLKELKNAGLIQGEVNPPKIKYCINKENWKTAKGLFQNFFE
ncbi:MAG TPA: metalloregulator ArsR/SmtB family transcription factor [Lutibacter sp.]